MRAVWTVTVAAFIQSIGVGSASAGSSCPHVGTTQQVICVCKKTYCWLEPGTAPRFYALFADARALTAAGALGVWKPVRLHPRRQPHIGDGLR
jgi:hypothetical protein